MKHSPEDAIEFAKGRIDKFARRQFWNVRGTEGEDLLAGHILLRIAVATDPRLSAWLVEFEGDLFDYRFRKASFSDIITVMRYFLGYDAANHCRPEASAHLQHRRRTGFATSC